MYIYIVCYIIYIYYLIHFLILFFLTGALGLDLKKLLMTSLVLFSNLLVGV